jgi:cellobiose-specific phosphotransferase system component IIA
MANADQMRDRASRLLAMALSARDKGQIEYADKLAKQASDVLDEATKTQALAIQPAEEPQPAAQQRQEKRTKKE